MYCHLFNHLFKKYEYKIKSISTNIISFNSSVETIFAHFRKNDVVDLTELVEAYAIQTFEQTTSWWGRPKLENLSFQVKQNI